VFQARDIEREINRLYAEVDSLLDSRLDASTSDQVQQIDDKLAHHQKRLFELEAY